MGAPQNRIRRHVPRVLAYLLAIALPAVSLQLRLALSSRFGDDPALELFLIPIILSAYAGGVGPGLLSTALVALATDYFLLPPTHTFSIQSGVQSIEWLVLILAGALMSVLLRQSSRTAPVAPSPGDGQLVLGSPVETGLSRTLLVSAGSVSAALGAVTLIGWFFHIPALTRVAPSFNPMMANTAIGFFLDGLGMLFLAAGRPKAALPGAIWSSLVGVLTLAEFGLSLNLHIDELLVRDYLQALPAYPGRPAPNAALCLVLCGIALFWAAIPRWRHKATALVGVLGAIVFALGAAAVCGYLIGLPMYALGDSKPMAANAGVGFCALGLGVMALIGLGQPDLGRENRSLWWAEWKVRAGFALAMSILLVVGGMSYFSLLRMREDRLLVDHAYQLISSLRLVPSTFSEAQAAIRGYIITGDEDFVLRLQKALSEVDAEMRGLRKLTANNRAQQVRLDALAVIIAERLALLQQSVELRRREGFAPAQQIVASRKGERLHERIVAAVAEMEAAEQTLLQERMVRTHHAAAQARQAILGGITTSFAIVVVALFVISRDFAGSRRAHAALQEAHDLLEARVQRRTAELARTNEALQDSEVRLAGIINSAMDAIITVDEQQRVVLFNPAAEKMFGRRATEVIDQPLDQFIPERSRAAHAQHHRAFAQTGLTRRHVRELGSIFGLRASGEEFPIEASISKVDLGGRILLTAILRDVTERVRAEEALRRQAALIDQIHDAVLVWRWNGPITFWSRGAQRLYGYSIREVIGKVSHDLLRTETEGGVAGFLRALEQKNTWEGELRHVTRDGRQIIVEARMTLVQDEGGAYVLETSRDITERKRAEDALQGSEERLRLFVEHAPAALAMFDREMCYLQVSRRWLADYGLGDRDVRGLSHYEIFPEVSARWKEAHRRGLAGEVLREECDRFERADGTLQWIRWEIRPWYETSGEIGGIVIFAEDITERKQAEEEVRRGQARLQLALRHGRSGVWEWDLRSGQNTWSEEVWRLYGLEPHSCEPCYEAWLATVHPNDRERATRTVQEAASGGRELSLEYRTLESQGQVRWLLAKGQPIRDAGGTPICYLGVVLDITEPKRAEAALRESEERLQRVTEGMTEGLVISDMEGELIHWNPAAVEMHGFTSPEVWRRQLPEMKDIFELSTLDGTLVPFEQWPFPRIYRGESLREYELRVRRIDRDWERVFSYGGTIVRDSTGKQMAFCTIADITERKRAEEEIRLLNRDLERRVAERTSELAVAGERIRAERQRLFEVLETLPAMICLLTSDYQVPFANRSFRERFGEPEGRPCYKFCFGRSEPCDFCESYKVLQTGEPHHWEVSSPDGSVIDAYDFPFTDADGTRMVLEMDLDITETRKAQAELKGANEALEQRTAALESANKELESFTYSVAHDLRAPLRAVDGFSDALLEDYGSQLPAPAREYLETIRRGVQRMGALIDDLLAFSRLTRQSITKQPVNMESLVRSVLADVVPEGATGKIQIVDGNLPAAHGDPALLRQVWANLLSNAVKYSRHAHQARIEIGSLTEGKKDIYYVRDNGAGFDMKYADKLFGVFQRLHRADQFEGTGIGLATVQRIVHRHGGRVWAEAKLNEGATFYFTLGGDN